MPDIYLPGVGEASGAAERAPGVNCSVFTATLAEINAGKVLLPAFGSSRYRIVNCFMKVAGNFAAATDIRIGDTAATPVVAITGLIAAFTDGAFLDMATTNVTPHATNFGGYLTAGKGVQIYKTGSAATGGTDVDIILFWQNDGGGR